MNRVHNSRNEKQTNYDIYRACRLCGAGTGYKMPIFQNVDPAGDGIELKQKIKDCVQIEVSHTDRMPPLICKLCVDNVNAFYMFLMMCQQNNQRFRHLLGLPQTVQNSVESEKSYVKKEPVEIEVKVENDSMMFEDQPAPIQLSNNSTVKKEPAEVNIKSESPGPSPQPEARTCIVESKNEALGRGRGLEVPSLVPCPSRRKEQYVPQPIDSLLVKREMKRPREKETKDNPPQAKVTKTKDSKLKRGKPINAQSREIIYNVYLYCISEANVFKKTENGYFNKVQDRVVKATGVSRPSLQRILREKDENGSSPFVSPKKGRPKQTFRMTLDSYDYSTIRNIVYDFHLRVKKPPTIKMLKSKLADSIGFQGCADTLRKILKDMGFRSQKTENNRSLLAETFDVRRKRVEYLRQIQALRAERKNIVFMDETYVNITTKVESDTNLKGKSSKGKERIIIIHAGNEKGFVPGAFMLAQCLDTDVDYHKEMNADKYQTWLRKQLIPNLLPNSVLVIDDAPCHNQLLIEPPHSNVWKVEMIAWLEENNIPFDSTLTKPELYNIIKGHKETLTEFTIDRILRENGHSVLRLPSYLPDFNPIENIFSQIKEYVAGKKLTNVNEVKECVLEKVNTIGVEEWKRVCEQAIVCEDEFRRFEHVFDNHLDNFVINVGSSSESDSDSQLSDVDTIDSD